MKALLKTAISEQASVFLADSEDQPPSQLANDIDPTDMDAFSAEDLEWINDVPSAQ